MILGSGEKSTFRPFLEFPKIGRSVRLVQKVNERASRCAHRPVITQRAREKAEFSLISGWRCIFQDSYNSVLAAGAAQCHGRRSFCQSTARRFLTRECGSNSQRPSTFGDDVDTSSCCATAHCRGACPALCPLLRDQPLFFGPNYTNKGALSDPDISTRFPRLASDIELFLLVRGPSAFLGLGFVSYHRTTKYTLPDDVFSKDYEQPLENCSAMPGKRRVSSGNKARVQVDCNRLDAGDDLSSPIDLG